ncbi:MAG: ABC transporter substrate-binding protein [Deltaproteobacteria bacterium]|nr:ABC transporter substrate-binding protein [Deltaproteobacteria bacterium]
MSRIPRILVFLAAALLAAAVHADEKQLVKASFIPQWIPQAQFAGYYTAYEKGFYAKRGIDLTILPGGPECPPDRLLLSGEADFCTLWLSRAVQLRAQGRKIVNIAQMLQRSALMLVAKKSSGIETPHDMNGKKVGLWGPIFQIQARAFFEQYGVTVQVIPQSFSVNLFLRGGVDLASAMWYNEYHTILNSGINPEELSTFFFQDYGLNFPEDGIYALEETYNQHPEFSCAFVEASIEGWRYAFAHPEETLDMVIRNLKQAHFPASRVHQRWMLSRMKELILWNESSNAVGALARKDFDRVASTMKDEGMIDQIPEFQDFYRKCHADR